jgi:hypothetical protein
MYKVTGFFQRPPFNLLQPFMGGHAGGLYIPLRPFQDTGGTTPASVAGQSIARINDQSGNSLNWLQATAASQLVLGSRPITGVTNRVIGNDWTDAATGAIAAAGSELIVNGLMQVDLSGWTDYSTGTGSATWSTGAAAITGGASGVGALGQSFAMVAGVIYTLQLTTETSTLTNVWLGTTLGGSDIYSAATTSAFGCNFIQFTAPSTGTCYLRFRKTTSATSRVYVVSCMQQRFPAAFMAANPTIASRRSMFTVTQVGVIDGVPTFGIRAQLPIGTVDTTITFNYNSTTSVVAAAGEVWSNSIMAAKTAGSFAGITSTVLQTRGRTAAGAGVVTTSSSNISSSLSSSLAPYQFDNQTLVGGTIARVVGAFTFNVTAATVVDITMVLGAQQIERQAVSGPPQIINSATPYLVTAPSVAAVLQPYGAGDDFMSTGQVAIGAETQGAYAGATNNWSITWNYCGFGDGTIIAQCGAVDANKMMQVRVVSGVAEVFIRGTKTITGITVADGIPHNGSLVCTNGVVTCVIDSSARIPITTGSAAAEAEFLTWFARTNGTPATFQTGFGQPVVLLDYAMGETSERQTINAMRAVLGGQ